MTRLRCGVIAACVVLLARAGGAQSVMDPRVVEFVPSADHAVVLPSGEPAVTRYELRLFLDGAADAFATYDLSKPEPGADGVVRLENPAWFTAAVVGWVCVARVAAIGPEGEGVSDPSNTFGVTTGGVPPGGLPARGVVSVVPWGV